MCKLLTNILLFQVETRNPLRHFFYIWFGLPLTVTAKQSRPNQNHKTLSLTISFSFTRTQLLVMASSQGKKRVTQGKESEQSLISRASRNVSQSSIVIHAKRAASEAAVVSKKLLRSTGKAAWIAGTTFLILAVPLIIEMDRDQQLTEIELQNASLLGTTPTPKWVSQRERERERETLLFLSFSFRVFEKFQTFFRDRDRESF